MYKKQLKIQKVVCLLALVVAVILFLYALGIMTDLYDSLYAGGNLPERSYHAFKAECNQLRELLK